MSMAARRKIRKNFKQTFQVVGSKIIAPNGDSFIPLGVNVAYYRYMMPGYTYDPAYSAIGHSSEALEWGWNTIRIPTLFADDFALLGQLIHEYTAKKIVCIIDCHELWRDQTDGALGVNSARIGQLDSFWQTMATAYKNNPYVWFNLHNEPPLNTTDWADLHIRHATMIRNLGAKNIIVCDAPTKGTDRGAEVAGAKYSWEAGMLPAVITAAGGNVILSFHNYGARWCDEMLDWYVPRVKAIAPLMIGEFGYNVTEEVASSAGSWDSNYLGTVTSLNASEKYGIGATMWIGSGGTDTLGLKAGSASFWVGGAGNNLAGMGPRLWAIGHGESTTQNMVWNWVANPCGINTQSLYGFGSGWSAGNGTISYRTGQSWAQSGTTTDVACDTAGYLAYYRSYFIDMMPAGVYTGSCEVYAPSAGSFQIQVQWQDSAYQQIGAATILSFSAVTGANTFAFTSTKPPGAFAIRIVVRPMGYATGSTFATTNLTTHGAEFFTGSKTNTAASVYAWSSLNGLSASAKVSRFNV